MVDLKAQVAWCEAMVESQQGELNFLREQFNYLVEQRDTDRAEYLKRILQLQSDLTTEQTRYRTV